MLAERGILGSLRASAAHLLSLFGILALVFFTGCSERELIADIDRQQSFDVILALANSGIAATEDSSARSGRYRLLVPAADYVKAVSVLREYGLPRESSDSAEKLTETRRFIPITPEMVRARLDLVLAGQVERLIRALPGVIDSRVILHTNGPETQGSMVIRIAKEGAIDESAVRELAQRAVPGLSPDRFTVTFTPVSLEPSVSRGELVPLLPPLSFRVPLRDRKGALQQIYVLFLLVAVCAFIIGMFLGTRGRNRVPARRTNNPTENFLVVRRGFQSGETQGLPAQQPTKQTLTKGGAL